MLGWGLRLVQTWLIFAGYGVVVNQKGVMRVYKEDQAVEELYRIENCRAEGKRCRRWGSSSKSGVLTVRPAIARRSAPASS